MAEASEIKVPKSYSLDPAVIAWVTQKAARLTIENEGGERASDSKVVNEILTAAMEADKQAVSKSPTNQTTKKSKPARVESVAA